MKELIVLSAIAGAGKSTWAEQYRKTHKHVLIVSSDEIRKELTGEYTNMSRDPEVWDIFFKRIEKYRDMYEDVTVITDSTSIYNRHRIQFVNIEGFDKRTLVILRKDLDVILKQNKEREEGKIVPEYAIKHMWDNWEEPSQEVLDGFDEYIEEK